MADPNLIDSLKRHEGYRTKAYQDTEGIWTVGYGHNLEANGVPKEYAQYVVVDKTAAERLLRKDIETARTEAELFDEWEYLDTKARRNVFVEMVFNLGRPRLKKFVRTLAFIRSQDWDKASEEMLDSKWARQVGRRAATLSALFRKGHYT